MSSVIYRGFDIFPVEGGYGAKRENLTLRSDKDGTPFETLDEVYQAIDAHKRLEFKNAL